VDKKGDSPLISCACCQTLGRERLYSLLSYHTLAWAFGTSGYVLNQRPGEANAMASCLRAKSQSCQLAGRRDRELAGNFSMTGS
jgi:hypothetical protein